MKAISSTHRRTGAALGDPQKRNRRGVKSIPVITVSREPGSGGKFVARAVADTARTGNLFHQELITAMAAKMPTPVRRVIRTSG
jgi:hypothetical protein